MTISPSSPSAGFDWDSPRFPSVDACVAIGCNTQWLADLITGSPAKFPLGEDEIIQLAQRRRFIFKFRSIFHLALIRRLNRAFLIHQARDLSRVCVDSDHLFPDDMAPDGRRRFLVIAPVRRASSDMVSKLFVLEDDEPGLAVEDLASVGDDPREGRFVLNVTEVFDQVVEGLDLLEVAGELVD